MVGSVKWNNNDSLQQWFYIFKSKKRSFYADECWKKLIKLGLPSNKDENWRYTSLENFLSQSFKKTESKEINISTVNSLSLPINAIRLVFIDGYLKKSLSVKNSYPFILKKIKNDYKYNLPEPINPEFFAYLNESLTEEIIMISLPEGICNKLPLYLLHISSGKEEFTNTINYRHHIHLENNTHTEIIEHYVSLNTIKHFTCSGTTLFVSNHANLKYNKMFFENDTSYHFSHNEMFIMSKAQVQITNLFLGSNLLKHNDSIKLDGSYSNLEINSLMLPINQDLYDNRSYLEHNKKQCFSKQIHKSIIRDKSRSIFNGILKVSKHAKKTDGYMINKNLLLNLLAEVYTKPQLEINTDDVKCRHSATVGYLDENQIFYLQSRGIDKIFAKNIIINGFTSEMISNITNIQCRQAIKLRIMKRISGALKNYEF